MQGVPKVKGLMVSLQVCIWYLEIFHNSLQSICLWLCSAQCKHAIIVKLVPNVMVQNSQSQKGSKLLGRPVLIAFNLTKDLLYTVPIWIAEENLRGITFHWPNGGLCREHLSFGRHAQRCSSKSKKHRVHLEKCNPSPSDWRMEETAENQSNGFDERNSSSSGHFKIVTNLLMLGTA